MTLTMKQLIDKYGESLRNSLLMGLVIGAGTVSSLNVLFLSFAFDLNLFIKVTGLAGIIFCGYLAWYWKDYVDGQKKNLKKQVAKMFASENGN